MERGLGLVLELLLLATCVNTLTNAEKNILTGRCTLVSADSSANCAHLHLKSVPQNLPSGIRVLDLSYNNLAYLKNGSFEWYKNLRTLNLDNNQIKIMESGIFESLSSLEILNLDKNNITDIPPFLFQGNPSLSTLSIAFNHLSHIPGAIQNLEKLTIVNLMGNSIQKLDLKPFSSRTCVESIDLSENSLTAVQQGDFKPLENCSISSLKLAKNYITSIPPKAFTYLSVSETLSLNHLNLSELDLLSLVGNTAIKRVSLVKSGITEIIGLQSPGDTSGVEELKLQHNRLHAIQDSNFRGFEKLTKLYLQSTRIRSLTNSSFCGLDALLVLNLSRNHIKSLPHGVFACITNLQMLCLSENEFLHFDPSWLAGSPSLVNVDLFKSVIIKIRPHPWNITSLRSLDISHNDIEKLNNYTFQGLPNLTFLKIASNRDLKTIPTDTFSRNPNLHIVNMTNIDYFILNGSFSSMRNLKVLDMRAINLHILPCAQFTNASSLHVLNMSLTGLNGSQLFDIETNTSVFMGLVSLLTLNLRENSLADLYQYPYTFSPLATLENLDLVNCKIRILQSRLFSPLASLKSLLLDNNRIKTLAEDVFHPLTQLQFLLLEYNQIQSVPEKLFATTHNLKYLYVQGNQISTIHPNTIVPHNLTHLDVSRNPFTCNCGLASFRRWLANTSVDLRADYEITCSETSFTKLVNKTIWSFHPDELCGTNMGIVMGVSLAIVTVIALCGLVYYRRWWFRYQFFTLKLACLGHRKSSEEIPSSNYEYQLNLMFHEADEVWVSRIFKPLLEERMPHVERVVFGDGGLPLGMFIVTAVYETLESSFKTVLLLSNRCVDDAWFMTKIQMAFAHVNDTKLDKVVLVFLEDIADAKMPYLVRLFLSKNKPYLLWTDDEDGQELFWAQFEKSMRENRVINNVIPI